MTSSARLRLAGLVLFLGISLGAFGAHGLAERLEQTGRAANWETATFYHLIHGLAMFVLALQSGIPRGYWFFAVGILLFSGSLYLLALTVLTKLVAVTLLGGVAFLLGWRRCFFQRSAPRSSLVPCS